MRRLRAKNPTLSIRPDLQAWLTVMAERLGWLVAGNRPTRATSGEINPNPEPRPAISATAQAALAFVATIDRDGCAGVATSEDALRRGMAEIRRREQEECADGRTSIRLTNSC